MRPLPHWGSLSRWVRLGRVCSVGSTIELSQDCRTDRPKTRQNGRGATSAGAKPVPHRPAPLSIRDVSRTVTLVLVDGAGALQGALPPFEVELPYWQEMNDVVLGARERYGVAVEVLRLLTAQNPRPHGGAVSYLAEATGPIPSGLEPIDPSAVSPAEQDEALRAAYAQPGGPTRSLAWARTIVGPAVAVQQRTWNPSAIWRLGGARRAFWLKQLPGFYEHEP